MRKHLFAAIALAALTMAACAQPAAAIEYPWCAQYGGIDDAGKNCGFTTYAQCMATVSGIGGGCAHNLFYQGQAEPAAKRVHKRHSHNG